MQLTEQFHIPDEYVDACNRLTTLVERHADRLLAEEYWAKNHIEGVANQTGQSYTYIRDDEYEAFNGVDGYLYSRFKRCVYQRVASVLEAQSDEYQAFQFVTETVEERKIKAIGWKNIREQLFTENSPYLQWAVLESVVEQLNNITTRTETFPTVTLIWLIHRNRTGHCRMRLIRVITTSTMSQPRLDTYKHPQRPRLTHPRLIPRLE